MDDAGWLHLPPVMKLLKKSQLHSLKSELVDSFRCRRETSEVEPRRPPTFKHVRHLADLRKGGAVGPGVHHVHQVGLELAQVRLLVHLQLGVGGHLGNPLGAFLTHSGEATPFDAVSSVKKKKEKKKRRIVQLRFVRISPASV